MPKKKNITPSVRGKKAAAKNDTSFRELVAWLYRRRLLRRKYGSEIKEAERKIHIHGVVCFFAVLFFLLSAMMTYGRLHRPDHLTESAHFSRHTAAVPNPALQEENLTCAVSLTVGNAEKISLRAPFMTVSEFLKDTGCTLSGDDYTVPSADAVLYDGMEVSVIRVTYEESRETVVLPYETDYVDCQTIPRDTTVPISDGQDGTANQLLRRRCENGVCTDTEVLESETLTEPVRAQMYRGVGGTVSGIYGTYSYSYYIDVTATAYGPPEFAGLTYTGVQVHKGVIAVDPDIIPLKTRVYVKGDYRDIGVCTADDIGGGIVGNKIDIWMDATIEEMLEFGVRDMRVYILD